MKINDYIISETESILKAMERINETEGQTIFVVDVNGCILGAITDGDIRRYLLKFGTKEDLAKCAMNATITTAQNTTAAKKLLKEFKVIPVVDKNNKIISIVLPSGVITSEKINLPVVINAGGYGTRLYPYTKILPKPLIPVGELPISEIIINKCVENGSNQFFMIVNHKKNMIKSYFCEMESNYVLKFAEEDIPLGTGGGLTLLRGDLKGDFIFTNCDVLIDCDYYEIVREHKSKNNIITMVCAKKTIQIPYGVIELKDNNEIKGMTEKPKFSYITNTGMYIVNDKVFNFMKDNESIDFPTVFENLREKGEKVGVYIIEENQWMDMGELEELEKMRKRLEAN